MRQHISKRIGKTESTVKIEGHRLVTVSLSLDDVQWMKSIVSAAKANGAEAATRSVVVREALRHLRHLIQGDPERMLEYLRGAQPW
ncbi:MAG: hypothetical protein LAP87_29130 [Acidobacteriia bacterium]|nr:hypothetical protein [Terriglobia bacterium]